MTMNFPKWLTDLSDKIDRLFRIPPYESKMFRRLKEQQEVEDIANELFKGIEECDSIGRSYELEEAIRHLPILWEKTAQVVAAHDSLMLAIRKKQNELLDKI